MKNIYFLLSVAVLAFSFSVIGFLRANTPNNVSFTYTATSTEIITKVTYDDEQAPQVEKYIDSCFQPELVFGDSHRANKDVEISSSQLKYHIKGSPGELKMTADKKSNSAASLSKLKNIFEGLKTVINP